MGNVFATPRRAIPDGARRVPSIATLLPVAERRFEHPSNVQCLATRAIQDLPTAAGSVRHDPRSFIGRTYSRQQAQFSHLHG